MVEEEADVYDFKNKFPSQTRFRSEGWMQEIEKVGHQKAKTIPQKCPRGYFQGSLGCCEKGKDTKCTGPEVLPYFAYDKMMKDAWCEAQPKQCSVTPATV